VGWTVSLWVSRPEARGKQKRYAEANDEIARVAKALEDEAALVYSAASDLEGLRR